MEKIAAEVKALMAECGGHGFDHIERVYMQALRLAEIEQADKNVVALAALLHDVDDYKFFGDKNAAFLTNARQIMSRHDIPAEAVEKVCAIISTMGYSKYLQGIRPQSLEGKIVSDADMLDAMGVNGIIRAISFNEETKRPFFERTAFPDNLISAESYRNKNQSRNHCVNHFFTKLLKLKDLMFTKAAQKEAEKRHVFMILFLRQFFTENDYPEWLEYLNNLYK